MTDNCATDILFYAELKPHRSAKPGAGFVVLLVLGFFWTVIGGGAAYFGVWPLSAFYGAEFLLIGGIIRMFIKTGNRFETITLTPDLLLVKGIGRYNPEKSFIPHRVRVVSKSEDRRFGQIEVSSNEENMVVGTFLSANECDLIAQDLNKALASIKEGAPIPVEKLSVPERA